MQNQFQVCNGRNIQGCSYVRRVSRCSKLSVSGESHDRIEPCGEQNSCRSIESFVQRITWESTKQSSPRSILSSKNRPCFRYNPWGATLGIESICLTKGVELDVSRRSRARTHRTRDRGYGGFAKSWQCARPIEVQISVLRAPVTRSRLQTTSFSTQDDRGHCASNQRYLASASCVHFARSQAVGGYLGPL